jgi:hypothetical protein
MRHSAYLLLLITLCSCSEIRLSLSDERNAHYRTLANIQAPAFEQDYSFDIRKRDRSIMAETTFFRSDDWSGDFVAGRSKDYKWMTGIILRYEF